MTRGIQLELVFYENHLQAWQIEFFAHEVDAETSVGKVIFNSRHDALIAVRKWISQLICEAVT